MAARVLSRLRAAMPSNPMACIPTAATVSIEAFVSMGAPPVLVSSLVAGPASLWAQTRGKFKKHNQPSKGGKVKDVSRMKKNIEDNLDMWVDAITPREGNCDTRSPEQRALDRVYSQQYASRKMLMHRRLQSMRESKFKLQKAALKALPVELQQAASMPDLTLFPLTRDLVMETPPFMAEDLKEMQEKAGGSISFDAVKSR